MEYAITKQFNSNDIKYFRKQYNLTQKDLADLFNVSVKTVEKWERKDNIIKGTAATTLYLFKQNPSLINKYLIESHQCNYRLYYMDENMISTIIDIDYPKQKIYFKNYTDDIHKKAFGVKETISMGDLEEFLESRCFPKSRDNLKQVLKELNIPFYDPMLIIEKTEGRMAEDNFWIKVERMSYD